MARRTLREGTYEFFSTDEGNRILRLGPRTHLAWVEGNRGTLLVRTRNRHEKKRTLDTGKYRLVDFKNDPTFRDSPHLFLEKGASYRTLVLPNGLPTADDYQKLVVEADERTKREDVERRAA